MRLQHIITALICTMLPCIHAHAAERPVDFLDYFLQKDDREMAWTIGGTDVRPSADPDGSGAQTYILTKFSNPNCYEVFKITNTEVQIRYEVARASGSRGKDNWIRRFEEIGSEGEAPGAVWAKRVMVPGGEGFVSRYRQDRLAFEEGTKSYAFAANGSAQELQTYVSVAWAQNYWGENNKTGIKLDKVLRLTSEWQTEGKILETYDYAKGKGLVSWRWLERINTLTPADGDRTGHVFHCENGFVYVEPGHMKPSVWKYAMAQGKKDRPLEVVRFMSHWQQKLGPQWYVVYRDLCREGPLIKRNECTAHDFALPEWQSRPGSTIADLPYVFTHPAH